jgi:hypothetical protein
MTILRVIKHIVRAGYGQSGRRRGDTSWFIELENCLTLGLSRHGWTARRLVKYVKSVTHRIYGAETNQRNCKVHHLCFLRYHDASSLPLQHEVISAGERTQPVRVEDTW